MIDDTPRPDLDPYLDARFGKEGKPLVPAAGSHYGARKCECCGSASMPVKATDGNRIYYCCGSYGIGDKITWTSDLCATTAERNTAIKERDMWRQLARQMASAIKPEGIKASQLAPPFRDALAAFDALWNENAGADLPRSGG